MTTCRRCGTEWTGLAIAHCTAPGCHRTFTTAANFDRHRAGSKDRTRKQGECSDPAACGLELNERGQWRQPGTDIKHWETA